MRLLRIDLTTGKFGQQEIPKKDLIKFMGGRGLAAKLLYEENRPGIDAFDPENRLIFMTGPYTGTMGSFTAFYNVTTKSPLTGTILSAHSGGHWGPMLRRTGYDGIVMKGKSTTPVYVLITDDGPELRGAGGLWGMDAFATIRKLKRSHRGARATVIGPAGETLMRFAAIINDMHRAAGRGGAGAVMGSKNLKAIVVHGTESIPAADSRRLERSFRSAAKTVEDKATAFSRYGTSMVVSMTGITGTIPTRNFQSGYFPEYEKISGDAYVKSHVTKSIACFRCPLRCGKELRSGNGAGVRTSGPEYETLATFGANLGNSNLDSIIAANRLCNRYGMDTISCADTIACAIELFEKGIISEKDTGGLRLSWGDHKTIVRIVRLIGERKGFGKLLGEGSMRFAGNYGRGASKYAMTVKGMEFPGYDPRGIQGMALAFATSTRGACHLRGPTYVQELFQGTHDRLTLKGKAVLLKDLEEVSAVYDSMILCKFGARSAFSNGWEDIVSLVNAATGHGYTSEELKKVGRRAWTIERLFNLREGFTRKDDTLPERLFKLPIPEGASKGAVVNRAEFERELENYYRLWRWTKQGVPTKKALDELGIRER